MHAASIIVLSWATIGAACFFPGAGSTAVAIALVTLVAVIGLPHGAADHRFARPRLEPILGRAWLPVFLLGYLAASTAIVLGWFLAPAATIVLFFLVSAWHFGQEEPRLAIGPRAARPILRLARGGLAIWVPVAMQGDEVFRILTVVTPLGAGSDVRAAAAVVSPCSWVMLAIAAIGWVLEARAAISATGQKRRVLLADCGMQASLVALFAMVSPVQSFIVYFCAWHSVRGLKRLGRELGESWSELVISLMPMTAAAAILVATAAACVLKGSTLNETLVRTTFVGLSAVAIPHLLLHGLAPLGDELVGRRPARAVHAGNAA